MERPLTEDDFETLLSNATESAIHLELRDAYMADDSFTAWLRTGVVVDDDPADAWWRSVVRAAVARGVGVKRARVISEPVSDYVRWEWACTEPVNVAAGEKVRWLPRHLTTGLCVPPSDFWVFDSQVVVWNHFSGAGEWSGHEVVRDPHLAENCATAFETVWDRGIDHRDYRPS
ncbi:hypothetical protein J4573_43090 [Actinomadura barringtoniae]|uniref:DUF6879 domain-containing protein n=1 Tax=Actinomadura barringtoniae TaxID=1427535 RepID=A0A939TBV9_9ACTN|nr:DUF6879 family protein [Actinomadura barringtoniae]MBO2453937.1 hypothetical protein [Actinomadura barringtoniae]